MTTAFFDGRFFIDAFNNYGVGWFEPFSHERISFNAIYVAKVDTTNFIA